MTGEPTRPGLGPQTDRERDPGIDDRAIAEALAEVWADHRGTVRAQICELEKASAALLSGSLGDRERREYRSTAHKLAGSLGSFGFLDGTRAARQVESLLGRDDPDPRAVSEATVALRDALPLEEWQPSPALAPPRPGTGAGVLLVFTDDAGLSTALEDEIRLSSYSGLTQPHPIPATPLPGTVALIIDVHGYDLPAVDRELSVLRHPHPLFLLVDEDDLQTRTAAERMGARGVLRRDSTPGQVIRFVEAELTGPDAHATVRVLGIGSEDLRSCFDADEVAGLTTVSWVPNARAAWSRLMSSPLPEAIVTTWAPENIKALRMLGADPRTANLPVVVAVPSSELLPEALRIGAVAVPAWAPQRPAVPEAVLGVASLAGRLRARAHDDPTGVEPWVDARRTFVQMLGRADRMKTRVTLAQVEVLVDGRSCAELPIAVQQLVARRLREICPIEDLLTRRDDRFIIVSYGASPEVLASRLDQVRSSLGTVRAQHLSGTEGHLDLRAAVVARPQDGTSIPDLLAICATRLSDAGGTVPVVTRNRQQSGPATIEVDLVLVEDDPATAALVERALTLRNLTCTVIDNGAEAAEALARGRVVPRIVLLDIGLPGMDGFGVLSRIGREDSVCRAPVIVLSSRYQEQEVQRAFSLGVVDHVTKPFGIPALLHRIDKVLQGAGR
jgi:CheY-like chemotaxis protein/HPt (histidine-containing phosphotransfer) domain-containing protein